MKKLVSLILPILIIFTFTSCGAKAPQDAPASAPAVPTSISAPAPASGMGWQEQLDLGTRYLSEGKYEEAILAFTKVIEIEPKNAAAYVGRGDAYVFNNDQLEAAFADYEKALSIDEKTEKAYLGLADVYIRQNQIDKALEIVTKGYAVLGSSALLEKKEEIESGNISDSSGNIRRETCYDGDGNLKYYHEWSYENGRQSGVTAHMHYSRNENYDLIETGERTAYLPIVYDDRGNEIESYWIDADTGDVGVELKEYDSNNNLIKSTFYELDGSVSDWIIFEYDSNGNAVKELYYDSDGVLTGWCENEYDSSGNKIKKVRYDSDGISYGWSEYEYYSDGNIRKAIHYDSNGTISGWDEYDANGNYTWYNADGTIEEYTEYQ